MNTKVDMQMNEIKDGQQLPDDSKYNFDSAIDPARSKHASSSSVEVQAGDVEDNIAEIEQEFSYDLLGNNLEGMDDFPQGDIEKFSKCLSGRRHAIGDNDDKPFSLIDGMFEKPIDGDAEKTSCGSVGVKSSDAIAGICGLRNFANTCYMNAGLQCLFATPSMIRYFCAEKGNEEYRLLTKQSQPKRESHKEIKESKSLDKDEIQDDIRMNTNDIEIRPECIPSNQKISLVEENESKGSVIDHSIMNSECGETLLLDNSSTIANEVLLEQGPNMFSEQLPEIKSVFGSLLEQIWSGNWSTLKPIPFKDTLEIFHPQFRGAHQQDCQEFLALLLDTLHEELRAESATKLISLSLEGGAISNPLVEDSSVNMASKIGARRLPENNGSTDDKRYGLSLESTVTENQCVDTNFPHIVSMHNVQRTREDKDVMSRKASKKQVNYDQIQSIGVIENTTTIQMDAYDVIRGSENPSPKSVDSQFSEEDKVTSEIRRLPIPNVIKCESSIFESSKPSSMKQVDGYISGEQEKTDTFLRHDIMENKSTELEYGDISDNSTRNNDDELYTMDSQTTSRNSPSEMIETSNDSDIGNNSFPTSNLLSKESLYHYRSKSHLEKNEVSKETVDIRNNIDMGSSGEPSFMRSISEYYQKENKTLNVNMADENIEMNNEISFDSEKFSLSKLEKMRPQETIDNLNDFTPDDDDESNMDQKNFVRSDEYFCCKDTSKPLSTTKYLQNYGKLGKQQHAKVTNLYTNDKSNSYEACASTGNCSNIGKFKDLKPFGNTNEKMFTNNDKGNQGFIDNSFGGCDFTEIKRIRLDSFSEKEINVQVAMEREKRKEISIMRPDHCLIQTKNYEIEPSQMSSPDDDNTSLRQNASIETDGNLNTKMEDSNMLKETIEADRCWDKYLAENDTIVARTFQGQFKNKVVCSVCHYVSVSFEPFMYLPVPLPNAHIRQVEVTLISGIIGQKPVTFLIELTHADSVIDLKKKLLSLLSRSGEIGGIQHLSRCDDSKMQVVEVLDHHISRTVDDWTSLNHLKDSVGLNSGNLFDNASGSQRRKIYLIEIPSLDIEEKLEVDTDNSFMTIMDESANEIRTQDNLPSEEYKCCMICMEDLPTDQLRQHNACDCIMCNPCLERTIDHSYNTQSNQEDTEMEALLLGSDGECGTMPTMHSLAPVSTTKVRAKIKCPGCMNDADIDLDFAKVEEDPGDKTCVICMDDFSSNQLLQHVFKPKHSSGSLDETGRCNAPMCEPCLRRTAEHHRQIKCPGCRQDANPCVEFVALNEIGKSKPRLRSLSLPVVCRLDKMDASDNNRKFITLFGHPGLVNVPNQVTGHQLNKLLKHLMPSTMLTSSNPNLNTESEMHDFNTDQELFKTRNTFQFVMVNAQGKNCSRCIWNSHCYGCIRLDPKDNNTTVLIQPSDTIAISFNDITTPQMNEANESRQHSSMASPRVKERLKLDDDCISAFSQSETLDENNPWYCPDCRKNQCATKTLTVWRFPDFLILYLKRFIFMGNDGTYADGNFTVVPGGTAIKLNKDVEFKVSGLDLTKYLSGPLNDFGQSNGVPFGRDQRKKPVFNLYGCVCHFGSIHGGHYTSYSKHLATGQWNYYDDCTVTEKKIPGYGGSASGDYSSAYILFYQRAGTSIGGSLSTNLQSISQFGGLNVHEEINERHIFSPEKAYHLNSRIFTEESPMLDNKFLERSRNNSTEQSIIKSTIQKNEEEVISQNGANTLERDRQQDETMSNKSNINEIGMIVETEEGQQPDLNEIIRSLDTPPPS